MEQQRPAVRLRVTSSAPAEVVYDLLSDLRTHLDWGGDRQWPNFRLKTLDAPGGPAMVGTVFSSTGAIPMSRRRWYDRSTVTVATRPTTFEFVTDARARLGRREMFARNLHRYEITPVGNGSSVTYTLTAERMTEPMLRFAIPVVRAVTWWMAGQMLARGLRNLLAAAARRDEAAKVGGVGARIPTQFRKEA
jgi:uncharacterized protein YodC (DUF2158 family)